MILSAGLTPAWQQILVFDAFSIGEVNRAAEVRWCAAGKVLNVAKALEALGAEHRTLALGGGETLRSIEKEFAELGISRHWVTTEAPTRVCTTIVNREGGADGITELVGEGSPMGKGEYVAFLEAYSAQVEGADVVLLTGSLPPGCSKDLYREAVARTRGRVVLDIRGEELLRTLGLHPLIVKPNREELGHTLGHTLDSDRQVEDAISELHRRGAQWVLITQGSGPVWLASPEDGTYRLSPPSARAVNPVGCGDSMTAAIGWGLDRGDSVLDAVRLGIGAAVQSLQDLVPAKIDDRTVEEIGNRVRVERTD